MNTKKLIPLFITTSILLSISLSASAYPETNEKYKCYSLEDSGLLLEIEATAQAWPEENTNITIRATATQANIHIRYIHVNIYGLKENGTKALLNRTEFLNDAHLSLGEPSETSYEMLIPEDTLPGWLYGEVEHSWSIEGAKYAPKHLNAFHATYIQNQPYEELRQAYEALNGFCNDLQANYTSLEANHADLQDKYQQLAGDQIAQNNATGLMYLFLITTAIFVVTTILLMIKRPKTTTW